MYKYQINIFWSEQDGAYIAAVPELPGCMADGETPTAALQNAEVVIGEWIETARELGRRVPAARLATGESYEIRETQALHSRPAAQ
jgi:predicted RNase H-like HicB family nuclease